MHSTILINWPNLSVDTFDDDVWNEWLRYVYFRNGINFIEAQYRKYALVNYHLFRLWLVAAKATSHFPIMHVWVMASKTAIGTRVGMFNYIPLFYMDVFSYTYLNTDVDLVNLRQQSLEVKEFHILMKMLRGHEQCSRFIAYKELCCRFCAVLNDACTSYDNNNCRMSMIRNDQYFSILWKNRMTFDNQLCYKRPISLWLILIYSARHGRCHIKFVYFCYTQLHYGYIPFHRLSSAGCACESRIWPQEYN